jgi:hypothetical protein
MGEAKAADRKADDADDDEDDADKRCCFHGVAGLLEKVSLNH